MINRHLTPIALLIGISVALPPAGGAERAQDGIDRNLLERAQREREFHIRLEDARAPIPLPPGPAQPSWFFVPRPGTETLRPERPEARAAPATRPEPRAPVIDARTQLNDSQVRRQVELQAQTQNLPDPARKQMLDLQGLGFERENRAQELGSSILRDSQRALGGKR